MGPIPGVNNSRTIWPKAICPLRNFSLKRFMSDPRGAFAVLFELAPKARAPEDVPVHHIRRWVTPHDRKGSFAIDTPHVAEQFFGPAYGVGCENHIVQFC